MSKLAEISGKNLAKLLDVDSRSYEKMYFESELDSKTNLFKNQEINYGENMITVMDALALEKIKGFPIGTRKVSRGRYLSGEVWIDNHYDSLFFYIGKLSNGTDVVMNLGGKSGNPGLVEIGNINDGNGKIFFDEKLFPY